MTGLRDECIFAKLRDAALDGGDDWPDGMAQTELFRLNWRYPFDVSTHSIDQEAMEISAVAKPVWY